MKQELVWAGAQTWPRNLECKFSHMDMDINFELSFSFVWKLAINSRETCILKTKPFGIETLDTKNSV